MVTLLRIRSVHLLLTYCCLPTVSFLQKTRHAAGLVYQNHACLLVYQAVKCRIRYLCVTAHYGAICYYLATERINFSFTSHLNFTFREWGYASLCFESIDFLININKVRPFPIKNRISKCFYRLYGSFFLPDSL